MTFEEFEKWIYSLELQTLTDELKDDIIHEAARIEPR